MNIPRLTIIKAKDGLNNPKIPVRARAGHTNALIKFPIFPYS